MFSLSLPTLHFFRLVLFLTILAIVRAAAQNDVSTASSVFAADKLKVVGATEDLAPAGSGTHP